MKIRFASTARFQEKIQYEFDGQKIKATHKDQVDEVDFTQVADAPYTTQEKEAWATYRQSLRDLPENIDLSLIGSVEDVEWPAKPE